MTEEESYLAALISPMPDIAEKLRKSLFPPYVRTALMLALQATVPMWVHSLDGRGWVEMASEQKAVYVRGMREGVYAAWSVFKYMKDTENAQRMERIIRDSEFIPTVVYEIDLAYAYSKEYNIPVYVMLIARKEIINGFEAGEAQRKHPRREDPTQPYARPGNPGGPDTTDI